MIPTESTLTIGPQCYNCQGFFHSAKDCHMAPACCKCAQRHSSRTCTKPFNEPCTCINCGEAHPANFRQCPKFPKSSPKSNSNSNSNKSQKTPALIPQTRAFTSKKANVTRSYSGAVTGISEQQAPPPVVAPPQNSVPRNSVPVKQIRPPSSL